MHRFTASVGFLGLLLLAACSDDATTGETPPPTPPAATTPVTPTPTSSPTPTPAPMPAPALTLSVPERLIIRLAAKLSFTVESNGKIEVAGLPPGVTAQIDGLQITLTASEDMDAGDYPFVLRAVGDGPTVELARTLVVAAKPGTKDLAFDGGVVAGINATFGGGARDARGRFLAVGNNGSDAFVMSFLPNGKYELTYGGGGSATTSFRPQGASSAIGRAIAVLPSGESLVATQAMLASGWRGVCVTKLDASGAIVSAFGAGGTSCIERDLDLDARTLRVVDGGKILIGGMHEALVASERPFVARMGADGKLDESFGVKGLRVIEATSKLQFVDAEVDTKGRVVVLAKLPAAGEGRLHRFSPDGAPDLLFNASDTPGAVKVNHPLDTTQVTSLALAPDDSIYAAGSSGDVAYLAAFNDAGKPLASLPGGGSVTFTVSNPPGTQSDTFVQLSFVEGKLFAISKSTNGLMSFLRIGLDGVRDETFGFSGTISFTGVPLMSSEVFPTADGRLVFAVERQGMPFEVYRMWN